MKAFFTSQFSFSPLIWMLQSRALNERINNIHKYALRRIKITSLHLNSF